MAAPGGLQRSLMTFRRSGSSGLVWEDRLFSDSSTSMITINGDNNKEPELRHSHTVGTIGRRIMPRSRSHGAAGAAAQPYLAVDKKVSPAVDRRVSPGAVDPPSPKMSGCGFFGIFRSSGAASTKGSKHRRR